MVSRFNLEQREIKPTFISHCLFFGVIMDGKFIPIESIRPGPIRHESLSDSQLSKLKSIYEIVGKYTCTSLETFEIDFMRDANPDAEIAIWSRIALAWRKYKKLFDPLKQLSEEDCGVLSGVLVAFSVGVDDECFKDIPTNVLDDLRACFSDPLLLEDTDNGEGQEEV